MIPKYPRAKLLKEREHFSLPNHNGSSNNPAYLLPITHLTVHTTKA